MRIGLDIMGGDYAPAATVAGAVMARHELPDSVELVLIGNKDQIIAELATHQSDPSLFTFVHTTEVLGMGDHPVKSFSKKKGSSLVKGFDMLTRGKLDAFCSAGNTGAMMAGAMFSVKSIPGIIRPAIAVAIPKASGGANLLLDVGLNPDARADVLYQYAMMGSMYSKHVYGNTNPRVGLLNIGSEDDKGNLLTKSTYQSMLDNPDFNFVGNVEGNELFADRTDVIVCDGFTGNVVLKQTESFYYLIKKAKIDSPFFEQFNYERFGGTPILGIGSPVLIGHGISSGLAIKNMLLQNKVIVESVLVENIRKAFK
jgi:glycerol-3-phosphate acyltransferase PlsX